MTMEGTYTTPPPLANITILGLSSTVKSVDLSFGQETEVLQNYTYDNGTLKVMSLGKYFGHGAWGREFELRVSLE